MNRPTCTITEPHCEHCGSTDYENVHLGDQGYTACCNELVAHGPADCRDHHGDNARWQAAYEAAARRLFGIERDALTDDQREACTAAADDAINQR